MAESTPPARKRKSSSNRLLLAVTLFGLMFFVLVGAGAAFLFFSQDKGEVADGSTLVVRLSGQMADGPQPGSIFDDPSDSAPLPTELAEAIRAAAVDDRISSLYFELNGVSGGWGVWAELRDAVQVFRAAGKHCVTYSEAYDDGAYYMASACDRVIMAPGGVSMVAGIASSTTYYKGLFDKLGVVAEMEHVGDFKSAVEPYQRTEPSEPASEAMNYLLDGLFDHMVAEIADGRGMSEEAVRALIDSPPMSPLAAVEAKLVDGLAFRDAVEVRLPTLADDGWLATLAPVPTKEEQEAVKEKLTSMSEYIKVRRAALSKPSSKVAVVYAEGAIVSGSSDGGLFGGSSNLADRDFARWMAQIRKDDEVKAVVLRVNSPGGSGLASDMMWREIEHTRAAGKPVVVSMADYAASGGYYIAAPADYIVAQPTTLTGSIGVFGGKINIAGAYEKLGLTQHAYKRGAQSDLFSPTVSFSDAGRETYRRFLSDFYETFLNRVGTGRNMDRDAVHAVAQGRVWTGTQALERKLVDELGGLDVAITKAAELGKIEGDVGVARWPKQRSVLEQLIEDLSGDKQVSVNVSLGLVDPSALAELELLQRVLAGGGVAAMLPGNLRVE